VPAILLVFSNLIHYCQ